MSNVFTAKWLLHAIHLAAVLTSCSTVIGATLPPKKSRHSQISMVSQLRTSILVEFFFYNKFLKPMEFADSGYLHIITSCPSSSTGGHHLSWKSISSFDEEVGTAAPVGHHSSQVLVLFQHFQVSSLLVQNRCLKLQCNSKPNQDLNHHLWCSPQVHWLHLGLPVPTTYLLGIRKPQPERPGHGGTSA